MTNAARRLAILLQISLVSACGLKAPLVLPPRGAAPAVPATQAPASPASAPVHSPVPPGCAANRAGSGDEPECASVSTPP